MNEEYKKMKELINELMGYFQWRVEGDNAFKGIKKLHALKLYIKKHKIEMGNCAICNKLCQTDTHIFTCEEHIDEALDILMKLKGEKE